MPSPGVKDFASTQGNGNGDLGKVGAGFGQVVGHGRRTHHHHHARCWWDGGGGILSTVDRRLNPRVRIPDTP